MAESYSFSWFFLGLICLWRPGRPFFCEGGSGSGLRVIPMRDWFRSSGMCWDSDLSDRATASQPTSRSRIEFLSSLGLEWEFAENWRLSYRFAHLSNAGISDKNPGLNLHLFSIGVRI